MNDGKRRYGRLRPEGMTLDLQDERLLRKVLPRTRIAVNDGCLAHEPYVEPAWGKHEARVLKSGYCWIKSRKVKGNWHHSKQRLVVSMDEA